MTKLFAFTAALLMLGIASLQDASTISYPSSAEKSGCPYLDANTGGALSNADGAIPKTGCPYLDEVHSKASAGEACPYSGESGVGTNRKAPVSSPEFKEI